MKPIKTEAIIFDDGQIIIDYTGYVTEDIPTRPDEIVPIVARSAEDDRKRSEALEVIGEFAVGGRPKSMMPLNEAFEIANKAAQEIRGLDEAK